MINMYGGKVTLFDEVFCITRKILLEAEAMVTVAFCSIHPGISEDEMTTFFTTMNNYLYHPELMPQIDEMEEE